MKLLHTADWHLGKRLDRHERLPEQRAVLHEICQIAEQEDVDAVLVAGDLFDTYNPPTEAVELLYQTLHRLADGGRRAVIAIAGNHDSPDRIEAPDPLARACGILLAGYPHTHMQPLALPGGIHITNSAPGLVELQLPRTNHPLRIILAPYANESRLRKDLGAQQPEATLRQLLQDQWAALATQFCDDKGLNLMLGHLLMLPQGGDEPDQFPEEEKRLGPAMSVWTSNLPQGLQYCALGHIHSYMRMGGGPCPAVYAGSPLAFSFPNMGQTAGAGDKHVLILEGGPGTPLQYRTRGLSAGLPLHKRLFPDVDSALQWLRQNQDCYVELHIETDTYLKAEERKQLMAAHPRIVGPIPKFKGTIVNERLTAIDLQLGREELFRRYFQQARGVEISEELMTLFREVTAQEDAP